MIEIGLESLKISCIIGCNLEERITPQDLLIDCHVCLNMVSIEDHIDMTVSYVDIANFIEECLCRGKFQLLEVLVQTVSQAILGRWQQIHSVSLKVRKPQALHGKAIPYAKTEVKRI